MPALATVADLNEYGRTRLSKHFFMREMLYSEVSNVHGVPNIPENPDLALEVGRHFCENILEPLQEQFGKVGIRSAYRSARLNEYCYQRYQAGDTACWCTENESNYAKHIWDQRDADGHLGATATIFIPAYLDHYQHSGGDYRPLAWWIRDHLPGYAGASFFRPLCAFNIRWYEGETDKAIWFLDPPQQDMLTRRDSPDFDGDHSSEYAGIIS